MEGGYPRKMEGSSAAEAAVTKATNKGKRKKNRAEKDAHNLRCAEHRKKKKIEFNQMRDENQRINREREEMNSQIQRMENENRILRRALEEQAANEAWMRQIPTGWNIKGQNFSSFDESVAWFALQQYKQVSQGANHDFPNVFDAPNNHDNIGMLTHNFAAGANHDFPNVFDAPNNHDNIGVLSNFGASYSGANADLPSVFYTPNNHDNNGSLF